MKLDGFLVGIAVAVALGFLAPEIGASTGPLHMDVVTDIGIAIVFFLHGAALSRQALVSAATNWRLHTLIQGATFVLFPLIGMVVFFAFGESLPSNVALGFFFLCAISSTISSSVAMTAMAQGNVPAAVFNATLSGLLGMALTPLLMGIISIGAGVSAPILPQIAAIFLKLLAPFGLGQLLSPLLRGALKRYKGLVSGADRLVILMIVYTAFCNATLGGLWTDFSAPTLLQIFALVAGLLVFALAVITLASRALGFSREDETAAVFCGCTKSLANGAPIASIIFGASPALPIILLPLLFYHQLQLIACGVLARRYALRATESHALAPAKNTS